jgi:fumarate hydratase class II
MDAKVAAAIATAADEVVAGTSIDTFLVTFQTGRAHKPTMSMKCCEPRHSNFGRSSRIKKVTSIPTIT